MRVCMSFPVYRECRHQQGIIIIIMMMMIIPGKNGWNELFFSLFIMFRFCCCCFFPGIFINVRVFRWKNEKQKKVCWINWMKMVINCVAMIVYILLCNGFICYDDDDDDAWFWFLNNVHSNLFHLNFFFISIHLFPRVNFFFIVILHFVPNEFLVFLTQCLIWFAFTFHLHYNNKKKMISSFLHPKK